MVPAVKYEAEVDRALLTQMIAAQGVGLEAAPWATIIIDREGIIRRANAVMHELAAWPKKELEGRSLRVLMTDSDWETHKNLVHRAFDNRGEITKIGEQRCTHLMTRDGTVIPINIIVVEPAAGTAPDLAIGYIAPCADPC